MALLLGPWEGRDPTQPEGSLFMYRNDFEYFKVLSVNNKNEITLKYSRVWAAGVNESSWSQMPVPLIEA